MSTTVKSGNWNDPTVWQSGSVPGNNASVTISTGHTVVFNVDQSGFANGLSGLVINGTLTFITDGTVTYLKMAGNITGSGNLYVGTESNRIPAPTGSNPFVATIGFNGAFQITGGLANLELWGEEREAYDIINIGGSAGDSTVTLTEGLNLREGDLVYISNLSTGNTATSHTVQSYNPSTKVVTFTAPLGRTIESGRALTLDSRNIHCLNINKTGIAAFTNIVNNGKASGVRFFNFGRAPIDGRSGWIVRYCTGNNNTQGGISHWGSAHTITSCTGNNNTQGGISHHGSAHTITSCTGNNNTAGGISHWGSAHTITSCTGNNNTNGGISHYGSAHTITSCTGNNNTNGGISYYGSGHTITFCNDGVGNTGGAIFIPQSFKVWNHQSNTPVTTYSTINNLKHHTLESFNTNQIKGNYQAYMNGGIIETSNKNMIYTCISPTNPVFRDYIIRVGAGEKIRINCNMSKSVSNIQGKLEIIDPAQDPLILSSNTALATHNCPDNTSNNVLSVSYTPDYTRNLIIRVSAQNDNGTVTVSDIKAWIGKSILKRRVQL
jgi:hypothetical protein